MIKNYDLRLKKLEGSINIYKCKPAAFLSNSHLSGQVAEHNKTSGEKLTVAEVMKWKKAKMSNEVDWLLSPGWIFEHWLKNQMENCNAKQI